MLPSSWIWDTSWVQDSMQVLQEWKLFPWDIWICLNSVFSHCYGQISSCSQQFLSGWDLAPYNSWWIWLFSILTTHIWWSSHWIKGFQNLFFWCLSFSCKIPIVFGLRKVNIHASTSQCNSLKGYYTMIHGLIFTTIFLMKYATSHHKLSPV